MTQKHDRRTALDNALGIFWKNGFHGTSLKDLEQGLSMHPGSIYAAFGSKAGLYGQVLEHYADQTAQMLAERLEAAQSPLEALTHWIEECHPISVHDGAQAACFVSKSIMDTGIDDPTIKAIQTRVLKDMEAHFADAFKQACDRGELSAETDCKALARSLLAALSGIALFSIRAERREVSSDMIKRLVEELRSLRTSRKGAARLGLV